MEQLCESDLSAICGLVAIAKLSRFERLAKSTWELGERYTSVARFNPVEIVSPASQIEALSRKPDENSRERLLNF